MRIAGSSALKSAQYASSAIRLLFGAIVPRSMPLANCLIVAAMVLLFMLSSLARLIGWLAEKIINSAV